MNSFEWHIPEIESGDPQIEWVSPNLEWNNEEKNLIPAQVEEILLDEYTWNSENWNQQEEYQKFQDFLKSDSEASEQCLNLMSTEEPFLIADYVYENGFIINYDTYKAFLQSFWVSLVQEQVAEEEEQVAKEEEQVAEEEEQVAEEEEQVAEEGEQVAEEEEQVVEWVEKADKLSQIISFNSLFQWVQSNLDNSEIDNILKAIWTNPENLTEQKMDSIIEQVSLFFQNLQNNPQEFQKIAESFHSAGETEFVEFKTLALQYNPDLAARFSEFEPHAGQAVPDIASELHRAQVVAGLGNNPLAAEKYGQFMEIQEGENITVMNVWVVPPSREVWISGSPMRLERNVPVGDFYESVSEQWLEYERFSAENDDTINAITTIEENRDAIIANLKSDTTIEWAEEIGFGDISGIETQDIDDVKRDIESQLWLPDGVTLDSLASMIGKSLNSRNDIKNFIESTDIAGLLGKLKDEKEAKRLAYQKALRDKSYTVSQSLESGDAIARDMIQNFHALWLDELWDELKLILNDPKIIASLQDKIPGFSWEHIDLANGKFGQSWTQENTTAVLRQNITMFANLIYFWDVQPKSIVQTQAWEQINTFAVGQFSRYERGQMISQDSSVWLLAERTGIISWWAINVGVLKQRLSWEI